MNCAANILIITSLYPNVASPNCKKITTANLIREQKVKLISELKLPK
jgi:hypothetical protein